MTSDDDVDPEVEAHLKRAVFWSFIRKYVPASIAFFAVLGLWVSFAESDTLTFSPPWYAEVVVYVAGLALVASLALWAAAEARRTRHIQNALLRDDEPDPGDADAE